MKRDHIENDHIILTEIATGLLKIKLTMEKIFHDI